MAVFPDRIVLKNSTDTQAAIEAAIQSGGTDEITQGEIVLGLGTGQANIYTRDATGAIVEISGAPLSIDEIGDVDTSTVPPAEGEALLWDAIAQKWEPGLPVAALPVAQDGEALIWQGGEWVAGPVIGGVDYTPAGTDPNIADVSLLLLFNGADGSTTFIDSSPSALAITPSGNAQISTTEFKFGGSSGYFDGTGDKIVVASDPGLAFAASDDFTIEFWIYPADGADTIESGGILAPASATGFTTGVSQIVYDHPQARNSVSIWNYADSTTRRAEAEIPVKDIWYHVAFVKSGTTITPYVNGVAGIAGTTNQAWDFSDGGTAIGEYYGYPAGGTSSGAFTGYLDDLRVTKGVARYTSNFTPPTVELGTSAGDIVIPYSIDKLDDVDTTTVAPTDGQALVWDSAAGKWGPGAAGVSVTSVNTLTGAVSLGIEDLDDFALNLNTSTPIYSSVRQNNGQNVTNDGEYTEYVTSNDNRLLLNWDQADGSRSVKPTSNGTIWLSADGINYSALAIDGNVTEAIWSVDNRSYNVFFDNTNWAIYTGLNIAIGGTLYWATSDPSGVPIPLADGDMLQYESVSSKFRPVHLGVDDLSDVDTSTVAPTDGQVLAWDNGASQWEPASLRTLLGIGEYADDAAAGTGGLSSGELYYNTTSSSYVLKS